MTSVLGLEHARRPQINTGAVIGAGSVVTSPTRTRVIGAVIRALSDV